VGSSGASNIQCIWALIGTQISAVKPKIGIVESKHEDIFALTAFHGMKGGENHFAFDNTLVDFIVFEGGDVAGNSVFDQCVFNAAN
jgi:hypothetical protein